MSEEHKAKEEQKAKAERIRKVREDWEKNIKGKEGNQ
jgi:hypothetical protein